MTTFYYFVLFCANQMIKRFNLEVTALGLKNEERFILVDNSIVLDFLRINKEKIAQIKTEIEAFEIVKSCPYFNPNVFKVSLIGASQITPLNVDLKRLVCKFIAHVRDSKPKCNYKFTKYTDVYNKVIDNFIIRYNLTNSVMSLTELKKLLNNKLNGELVMQWMPDVKPGPLLGTMLKQFKEDIETKCPYDVYLFKNSEETIKNDFVLFFTV